jgi:choline-sulfatase
MRTYFSLFALLLLPFGSGFADNKPNLLFIFADDMCFETVGAFGHTDIDTPNLDRLVQRGTSFTAAYNMGSWSPAVCLASRAMLLTGHSVWKSEQASKKKFQKELEAGELWPQLMRKSGYRTYITGKWHVHADASKCFDVARNVRGAMPQDRPHGYDRPPLSGTDPWSPYDTSLGGFWTGGKHWSEVVGDDAVDFLSEPKNEDQPFFIYAAFNAPHDPRQAPKEFVDQYPIKRIALPKNFLPEYPHKDAIGCSAALRDERLAPFPRTENAIKVHRQEYYASITHMDAQIGRILAALEKSGRSQQTWIIFTADHGLAVGHHGLMGKQNPYEHSVRVPFIVVGPGVGKNKRISTPIYLQDAMATALDLAGAEKPAHVFFNSLRPLLDGKQQPSSYDSIYGSYLELQRSITHEGWKLIAYPKPKVLRLYNLSEDPQEMNDLANAPQHTERIAMLLQKLTDLQKRLGDQVSLADLAAAK